MIWSVPAHGHLLVVGNSQQQNKGDGEDLKTIIAEKVMP
jgi:hypothetical protein